MRKLFSLIGVILLGLVLVGCNKTKEPDPITKFKVTFLVDGGTEVPFQEINDNELATRPDNPTKPNHSFDNWYEDEAYTTLFDFNNKKITEDTSIYAKWIINEGPFITHTITFDSDGGTLVENIVVDTSTKLTKPNNPEKNGYTFIGWYLDDVLYDFDTLVTKDLTLKAKWEEESPILVYFLVTFDSNNGSNVEPVEVLQNGKITKPKNPTKDGFEFIGWYSNNELYDFNSLVTTDLVLIGMWDDLSSPKLINNEQDLLNLFKNGGSRDHLLTKDLDFTNILVTSSSATFSGVLDGGGFEITNIKAQASTQKEGVFFKYLDGGTIKNFKITNSSLNYGGGGEGTAFITYAVKGNVTFDNLEFINVSVFSIHSYSALLFADNTGDTNTNALKTINRITVINNTENSIHGKSYTGGLVGYGREDLNLTISNVYFDSTVKSMLNNGYDQAAGSLIGRIAGQNSTITVENTVIKGSVLASKNVGPLIGTSASGAVINANNVIVSKFSGYVNEGKNVSTTVGNENGMEVNLNNYYYHNVSLKALETTIKPSKGLIVETITELWLNSSGLTNYYKVEDEMIVLNRETAPKIAIGISIVNDSIKTLYYLYDELDLTTLDVRLNYSNGSSEPLENSLYEVNSLNFDRMTVGEYEIIVTYNDFEAVIILSVVEIVDYIVHTIDFNDVYLVNETLNSNNIYLEGILSNGNSLYLTNNDFSVNANNVDFSKEGVYSLKIEYLGFAPTSINIYVVGRLLATGDFINLTVDASTTNDGLLIENELTFKTIKSAINYFNRLNLSKTLKKVIYIKNGIYEEKLFNNMENLIILGESQENTIIQFYSPSGAKDPKGVNWGTQGSAIFTNKGDNFTMANLTVLSTFDYFNTNIADKQAVTIVNEGDKALFYKVKMLSVQDTLYAKSGRQWYLENYIEGAVDYIFGNGGPAFFEQNRINTLYRSNAIGVIATNKGVNDSRYKMDYVYVFYDNTFLTNNTSKEIALGRPWEANANMMYIKNYFQPGIKLTWDKMNNNLPENALFYEYENYTFTGKLENTIYSKSLTLEQAKDAINKDNVFAVLNGQQSFNTVWDYERQFKVLSVLMESLI